MVYIPGFNLSGPLWVCITRVNNLPDPPWVCITRVNSLSGPWVRERDPVAKSSPLPVSLLGFPLSVPGLRRGMACFSFPGLIPVSLLADTFLLPFPLVLARFGKKVLIKAHCVEVQNGNKAQKQTETGRITEINLRKVSLPGAIP